MSDRPLVSVITPSVRPAGLEMVGHCLYRQTEQNWEWLISLPEGKAHEVQTTDPRVRVLTDPPARPGDFYRLNRAWNQLVAQARAQLLVFAVDWIWFEQDAIERFLGTYRENPKAVVTAPAHHYRKIDSRTSRPAVLWESDQRVHVVGEDGSIPWHMTELSFCSVPRQDVIDVGGFDEEYDRVAGMSEKELAGRLHANGCQFYLGMGCEHRILTHRKEVTAEAWDRAFAEGCKRFERDMVAIKDGSRRVLDNPTLRGQRQE